jgi:hypothetical protein
MDWTLFVDPLPEPLGDTLWGFELKTSYHGVIVT